MLAGAAHGLIQRPRRDDHRDGRELRQSLSRSSLDNGSASFAVGFGALRLGMLQVVSSGMGVLTVLCAAIEFAVALSVNACVIAN